MRRIAVLSPRLFSSRPNNLTLLSALQFSTTSNSTSTSSPPPAAPLSPKCTYSLLQLSSYTENEITTSLTRLTHPSSPTLITHSAITEYIGTLKPTYQVGWKGEAPEHVADRFMATFEDQIVIAKEDDTEKEVAHLPLPLIATTLHDTTKAVDLQALLPITSSMLLVGSCVGMITPVMPYIVENLSLSTAEFGYVVSAFGLAKLLGNIPSAILVERHGRKPYLVYSLLFIGGGSAGIGFAGSLDQLLSCRMAIGFGVAALSTAATLSITDISTPNNRASTMAPVMAAFSAGTALGPAMGGILADTIGLQNTFALVGTTFLANAVLNSMFLNETQKTPYIYKPDEYTELSKQTLVEQTNLAIGQWAPIWQNPMVRNAIILNSCYWVTLAGSQMTLLPLMLTDEATFAMTATQLGKVYAGMSVVQVVGSQPLAYVTDRIGKRPIITAGCALVGSSIVGLSQCTTIDAVYAALFAWSIGGVFLSTAPLAYVSDKVPEGDRAQAIALLRTCGDIGLLVGASCTGALADWTSIESAMGLSGGFLAAATGWYAVRTSLRSTK